MLVFFDPSAASHFRLQSAYFTLKRDLPDRSCHHPGMHLMRLTTLLIGAALLEVGGDALVRIGLQRRPLPMIAGAVCLVTYGVVVNMGTLDFGRLMGAYIAIFFVVSQIIAALLFGPIPGPRTIAAGALMLAAAAVMIG
jgi:small multidrug resistance family-3 protein